MSFIKRLNEEPLQKTKYLPRSKPFKALLQVEKCPAVFFIKESIQFQRSRSHTKEMDGNKFLKTYFYGCFHVGINRIKKMVTDRTRYLSSFILQPLKLLWLQTSSRGITCGFVSVVHLTMHFPYFPSFVPAATLLSYPTSFQIQPMH